MKKIFKRLMGILLLLCLTNLGQIVYAREEKSVDYAEINQQLAKDVEKYHIPGMAVIVVDKDKILFQETYGSGVSVDSPFIIGSMSKSFTALAIMQLVEQGKIDLDDPISTYLDVSKWFVENGQFERISVRDLLHHTSGISTYQTFGSLKSTDSYGNHVYANANYGLLGLIIEAVSEESYEAYVTSHIFQPLKMDHSSASLAASKEKGLIAGYRNYFGIPIEGESDYPAEIGPGSWTNVPAGYLSSSISDMGRYLQMYLRDEDGLVGKESIKEMLYDRVPVGNGSYQYGLGWGYSDQSFSKPIFFHAGLVENYTSNMFILPEKGIGVVVLVNMNDYLVTNNVLDNMVKPFIGEPKKDLPNLYLILHTAINALYLLLTLIMVFSLATLRKWKEKERNMKGAVIDFLRHVLLPVGLLSLPVLLDTRPWVIWLFVKDLFWVVYLNAGIILAIGAYKLFFQWKNKNKKYI